MIFCRAVSFLWWLETFGREFRYRFGRRFSRAPSRHTPCPRPSSSSEKVCRLLLRRCVPRSRTPRNAVAVAVLSLSFETARAFRAAPFLLFLAKRRVRRSLILSDRQKIPVLPRSDFVLATDPSRSGGSTFPGATCRAHRDRRA